MGTYRRVKSFTIAAYSLPCSSLELCSCPYDTKTRFQPASCFLTGRRGFCEIRATTEMIRVGFSDRGGVRVEVLDSLDNSRSVAHRHKPGNKAPCYPVNTVIARCANGTDRRPTRRFEYTYVTRLGIPDEGR